MTIDDRLPLQIPLVFVCFVGRLKDHHGSFRLRRSVPLAAGAAVAPSAAAAAVPSGRHAALAVLEKPVASREIGGAIEGDGFFGQVLCQWSQGSLGCGNLRCFKI